MDRRRIRKDLRRIDIHSKTATRPELAPRDIDDLLGFRSADTGNKIALQHRQVIFRNNLDLEFESRRVFQAEATPFRDIRTLLVLVQGVETEPHIRIIGTITQFHLYLESTIGFQTHGNA